MAQRPWRVAVAGLALAIVLAAVIAAVGAAAGARAPLAAGTAVLGAAMVWATLSTLGMVSANMWRRLRARLKSTRRRPPGEPEEGSFARRGKVVDTDHLQFSLGHSGVLAFLLMVGGTEAYEAWEWMASWLLVTVVFFLAGAALARAVQHAARGYPQATEYSRRQGWRADHPWCAALADVAPVPLGMVVLIVVHPAAASCLRVALVMLVAALTALAVAAVRLEQSRQEKDYYQHAL